MVRAGESEGLIKVTLGFEGSSETQTITTRIKKEGKRESVSQESSPGFPYDRIFTCGYGVSRGIIGSEAHDRYRPVDALYTLFSSEGSLWSAEVALTRLERKGVRLEDLLDTLTEVLMLPKGTLTLDASGLKMRGVPLDAVGDGYSATLSLLADLLAWAMLFSGEPPRNLSGIVLIDEIEQHLHPTWQRRVLGLLHRRFRKVQFIGTTHAPMCVVGTTDLKDEDCDLVVLNRDGDSVSARSLKPPRRMRADQVLTSFLFDLGTAGDNQVKEDIKRYADLSSRARNSEEDKEFRILEEELGNTLGTAETPFEEEIQEGILEALRGKYPEADQSKRKRWLLEIQRQLSNLRNP